LQKNKRKNLVIQFDSSDSAEAFASQYSGTTIGENQVSCSVSGDMDTLIKALSHFTVRDLEVRTQTLEEFFLHFYGGED
jgi:ABC-2 type transport system ATP-binding protein